MDLDAYVAAHVHEWQRLEQLTRTSRLRGVEADELVDRIQQVSTHLSVIRSSTPDASLVGYLSGILTRARSRTVGTRTTSWHDVVGFFARSFPAALYAARRWWVTTALVNVVVAVVVGWWFYDHPRAQNALISPREVRQLVNVDFAGYYREYAASHFAAQVWTNNAWVAAVCIAFGILGLPVVYLLWTNVLNVAIVGSLMLRYGRGEVFFGLILPHGILELTAVFVAGAFGLRIFWAWVDPGEDTRSGAVGKRGREAAAAAMGLAAVLLVSGIIEAFVTPSPLPTWARIGIGVLAELAFLLYVFVVGRRAFLAGATGDVDARDLPDTVALST